MNKDVMFSKKSDEWETPQHIFDELNKEFNFTLDPCATEENRKCNYYFTKEDNGLNMVWLSDSIFINPPYSNIKDWVKRSYEESLQGKTVVLLVPSRTDTKWFHECVYGKAEIRFIKGRLKFGNSKNSAPFPSMIIIYRGQEYIKEAI